HTPTMFIGIQGTLDDARAVAALPPVADGAVAATVQLAPPRGYQPAFAAADDRLGVTISRDRLLRGRRPAPGAPHEITVSEATAARYGIDVGGHIDVHTPSVAQGACMIGSGDPSSAVCQDTAKAFANGGVILDRLAGPRFSLAVVGITRGPQDI